MSYPSAKLDVEGAQLRVALAVPAPSQEPAQGIGVGLYLVRQLMKAQDGSVRVMSGPDGGASSSSPSPGSRSLCIMGIQADPKTRRER